MVLRPIRWWALASLVALVAASCLLGWRLLKPDASSLASRLARVQGLAQATPEDCVQFKDLQPLVLLVLGQSNAANHGVPGTEAGPAVRVVHDGRCAWARDPLPGGTGNGASVWTLLPQALQQAGVQRAVVLQVLAVDASTLQEWVAPDSALRRRLVATLAANRQAGLTPDLVLWQQGEADARDGRTQAAYALGLRTLGQILRDQGVQAPVMLARSTVCRSSPHGPVRAAADALAAEGHGYVPGPDTDRIPGPADRADGCHWNAAGRLSAARLWAQAISSWMAARGG